MSNPNQCPRCGAEVLGPALDAPCPACLMKLGLATWNEQTEDIGQDKPGRFEPPSVEDLAESFPQLEIAELLGAGGMGAVYKARQKELDRWVALKILPPEVGRDPTFAERFSREARALAKLNHASVVTIYDSGRSGDYFFFLMEFVDGANLRQMIRAGGIKPPEALAIVPQICEALQYAHDEGVVHRDIKPENILVDSKGRAKIADFGLAKLLGRDSNDVTLTGAGQVMGTPHYMAPEQLEHPQDVDHRVDIYSLGVVLYEMLTGELPLGRFAAPSTKVAIDVRLDEVVLRALEKEPERRYQQASEVRTDVESVLEHSGQDMAPRVIQSFDQAEGLNLITTDGVDVDDNAWRIQADAARTVRLFEVPEPGEENCILTYRAWIKTENLQGRAYLEMWCRLPGRGEFFSKGFAHAVSGTNDWACYEIPFFLRKGQRPDLLKLNLAIEGEGTVWIKDVELTAAPHAAGNSAAVITSFVMASVHALLWAVPLWLLTFFLPRFQAIFADFDVELSWTTLLAFQIGDLLTRYWYIVFMFGMAALAVDCVILCKMSLSPGLARLRWPWFLLIAAGEIAILVVGCLVFGLPMAELVEQMSP